MSKNKNRRSERALAFQVLYGLAFSPAASMGELRRAFRQSPDNADKAEKGLDRVIDEDGFEIDVAPQGFAWELVEGVWTRTQTLDEIIGRFSRNWRVDRMGRIELTLLRMGIYEMLYRDDVPSKVAINEALELAKQFGENNARSFVNGILDAAAKALESGELSHQA